MPLNQEVFRLTDRRQLTISVFVSKLKSVMLTASRLKPDPNPHQLSDLVARITIEDHDETETIAREVNAGRCSPAILADFIEDRLECVRTTAHSSVNREAMILTILTWLRECEMALPF